MSSSHGAIISGSLGRLCSDAALLVHLTLDAVYPLNPTLVDALVVVLIGLYVLEDVRNGILYGLVQLAGLLLALLAALLLYPAVASQLVEPRRPRVRPGQAARRSAASGC